MGSVIGLDRFVGKMEFFFCRVNNFEIFKIVLVFFPLYSRYL